MIEEGATAENVKTYVEKLSSEVKDDLSATVAKDGHSLISLAASKGKNNEFELLKALIDGGLLVLANKEHRTKTEEQAETDQKDALILLLEKAKQHHGDTRPLEKATSTITPTPVSSKAMPSNSFESPRAPITAAGAILSAMDTSGDGFVSYGKGGSQEFEKALSNPEKLKELLAALDKIDGNEDGKITRGNLRDALESSTLDPRRKMTIEQSVAGLTEALKGAGVKLDAGGDFVTGSNAPAPLATGPVPNAGSGLQPK